MEMGEITKVDVTKFFVKMKAWILFWFLAR